VDFYVTQVDPRTLSLGSLPLPTKNNGQAQCTLEDVNGDAYRNFPFFSGLAITDVIVCHAPCSQVL
jgi:hypothetical protein